MTRISIIVMLILFVLIVVGLDYSMNFYRLEDCTVTQATKTGCTIVDEYGQTYYWEFKGKQFIVGDKVNIKMYNNETTNYTDDDTMQEVTKIKKYLDRKRIIK